MVEAVWTRATYSGEVVSVVMSHAAATSFIHMQVLAASQVSHSMRNTGRPSGARVDCEAAGAVGAAACDSGGMGHIVPAATAQGRFTCVKALVCPW